jgi:hypothetical protein
LFIFSLRSLPVLGGCRVASFHLASASAGVRCFSLHVATCYFVQATISLLVFSSFHLSLPVAEKGGSKRSISVSETKSVCCG